jgi:hypothetical protein
MFFGLLGAAGLAALLIPIALFVRPRGPAGVGGLFGQLEAYITASWYRTRELADEWLAQMHSHPGTFAGIGVVTAVLFAIVMWLLKKRKRSLMPTAGPATAQKRGRSEYREGDGKALSRSLRIVGS